MENLNLKTDNLENTEPDFSYSIIERRPRVIVYMFDGVGVIFDTTGKNQSDFTELGFGTFADTEKIVEEEVFIPSENKKHITMSFIAECTKRAIADYGEGDVFWVCPWDADGHGESRLRLFKKYGHIEPSEKKPRVLTTY